MILGKQRLNVNIVKDRERDDMLIVIFIALCITQCVLTYKMSKLTERVEDDLVDIELTYERMRCVITYLKDCIQYADNK